MDLSLNVLSLLLILLSSRVSHSEMVQTESLLTSTVPRTTCRFVDNVFANVNLAHLLQLKSKDPALPPIHSSVYIGTTVDGSCNFEPKRTASKVDLLSIESACSTCAWFQKQAKFYPWLSNSTCTLESFTVFTSASPEESSLFLVASNLSICFQQITNQSLVNEVLDLYSADVSNWEPQDASTDHARVHTVFGRHFVKKFDIEGPILGFVREYLKEPKTAPRALLVTGSQRSSSSHRPITAPAPKQLSMPSPLLMGSPPMPASTSSSNQLCTSIVNYFGNIDVTTLLNTSVSMNSSMIQPDSLSGSNTSLPMNLTVTESCADLVFSAANLFELMSVEAACSTCSWLASQAVSQGLSIDSVSCTTMFFNYSKLVIPSTALYLVTGGLSVCFSVDVNPMDINQLLFAYPASVFASGLTQHSHGPPVNVVFSTSFQDEFHAFGPFTATVELFPPMPSPPSPPHPGHAPHHVHIHSPHPIHALSPHPGNHKPLAPGQGPPVFMSPPAETSSPSMTSSPVEMESPPTMSPSSERKGSPPMMSPSPVKLESSPMMSPTPVDMQSPPMMSPSPEIMPSPPKILPLPPMPYPPVYTPEGTSSPIMKMMSPPSSSPMMEPPIVPNFIPPTPFPSAGPIVLLATPPPAPLPVLPIAPPPEILETPPVVEAPVPPSPNYSVLSLNSTSPPVYQPQSSGRKLLR